MTIKNSPTRKYLRQKRALERFNIRTVRAGGITTEEEKSQRKAYLARKNHEKEMLEKRVRVYEGGNSLFTAR